MKKIIFIIPMALLFCFTICGCGCDETNNDNVVTTTETVTTLNLPDDSIAFINAVKSIVVTLGSGDAIDDAYIMYEELGESSWHYDEVLAAYDLLEDLSDNYYALLNCNSSADNFIQKVNSIPYNLTLAQEYLVIQARDIYDDMPENVRLMLGVAEANEQLEEYEDLILLLADNDNNDDDNNDETNILAFTTQVMNLKNAADITTADEDDIEQCLEAYDGLSASSKELSNIVSLYGKLNACKERLDYLVLHPEIEEQVQIDAFSNAMTKVPAADDVTLTSIGFIRSAEEIYNGFNQSQKNNTSVTTAYALLQSARTAYNTLYFEEIQEQQESLLLEERQEFIDMINNIPTTITATEGPSIQLAFREYENMDSDAKDNADVTTAYNTLLGYHEDFNGIASIPKVPCSVMNLLGNGNNPDITLQGAEAAGYLYPSLANLYGVATNALAPKCSLYLVVYQGSSPTPLFEAEINQVLSGASNVLAKNVVIAVLEKASITNEALTSGNFSFGLKVYDKTGLYRDSDIYKSATTFNYTFTSQYGVSHDTEAIEISNLNEFLAIRDNLNGNYVLVNDIDLSSIRWVNLGNFGGVLDGQGHTLFGLNCTKGPDAGFGIFLEILATGVVCNLKVMGDVENAGAYAGLIAVRNRGIIKDCLIDVDMRSAGVTDLSGDNSGDACIGGIVAENFATIQNVIVLSNIEGEGTQWGPLDGALCVGNTGTIINCYAIGANVSTGKAVGNSDSLSELLLTENEIKDASNYNSFNRLVWDIVNGYLPSLFIK